MGLVHRSLVELTDSSVKHFIHKGANYYKTTHRQTDRPPSTSLSLINCHISMLTGSVVAEELVFLHTDLGENMFAVPDDRVTS